MKQRVRWYHYLLALPLIVLLALFILAPPAFILMLTVNYLLATFAVQTLGFWFYLWGVLAFSQVVGLAYMPHRVAEWRKSQV